MTLNSVCGTLCVAALAAIFYYGHHESEPDKVAVPATTTTVAAKPAPKGAPHVPGVVFYRVTPGGGRGPAQECSSTKPYTEGKTPDELAAIAKRLGVTQAELATYFVCVE